MAPSTPADDGVSAGAPVLAPAAADPAAREPAAPTRPDRARVSIGRARIDDVSMDEAIERIEALIARRRPRYVVTPNVDHLVKLEDDPEFRDVYARAALVLADGMPLVWASRLLGTPLRAKVSGSDLFVAFAEVAARRGYRLYFLGGREGAAARAADILAARHPGLTVCGVDSPPLGFEHDHEATRRLVARIRAARPDVLFVGLGAPKQEKWIHRWHEDLGVPVSVGVGVSFEFVAGMVRRAPMWMQRAGLEWAWRLLMEPRRLWRRYLVEDSRFLWLFLRQWVATRGARRSASEGARGALDGVGRRRSMVETAGEARRGEVGGAPEGRATRIAYLINQYPKGSHTFIRREIQGLEAQGVAVERFSIRSMEGRLVDAADFEERERTHVLLEAGLAGLLAATLACALTRPLAFARTLALAARVGWRSERGLAVHAVYLMEACLLLRALRARGVEHLHAHFGTNPAAVAMLCRSLGGPPFSFTAHGPEEFDKPDLLALTEKIDRAEFVVGVSSFGRSQLFRRCAPERWRKVRVVHCGVDASFLEAPHVPPPEAARLVCVGRLCEQKGQLLLVEAAARLAREGRAFKLVLVGDGELRARIEDRLAREGLEEQVEITGWASGERVREELLAARAMVLPSFAEGLPVVIMEALALGRPVLSTYVAGIPELVTPDCGWLIPAGSVDALVDAMREVLLASPAKLDEMGRVGRERVRARHDADRSASRLVDLFRASARAERARRQGGPLVEPERAADHPEDDARQERRGEEARGAPTSGAREAA